MKTEIENSEKKFQEVTRKHAKMVILVTFGGCRARWLQGDIVNPFERVSNAVFGCNLPLFGCPNTPESQSGS